MDSKIINRRDLDFMLYDMLDVESLTTRPRFADHSRDTFDAAIDLSMKIATDHYLPHLRKNDTNEPRFENGRVVMIPEVKAAVDQLPGRTRSLANRRPLHIRVTMTYSVKVPAHRRRRTRRIRAPFSWCKHSTVSLALMQRALSCWLT